MNELFSNNFINLEDAIDELCENCFMQNCSHDCDVIKSLRKVTAADVRPVVHGEWKEIAFIPGAYDIDGIITWANKMSCSKCDFTTYAIEGKFSQYNFCPNCGADMRNI